MRTHPPARCSGVQPTGDRFESRVGLQQLRGLQGLRGHTVVGVSSWWRAVATARRPSSAPGRRSAASRRGAPVHGPRRSALEANLQGLAVDHEAIDVADGRVGVGGAVEIDEAEAAAHACLLVADHVAARQVAVRRKELPQIPVVEMRRQPADIDVAVGRTFFSPPASPAAASASASASPGRTVGRSTASAGRWPIR